MALVSSAGILRPAVGDTATHRGSKAIALALGCKHETVKDWLEVWFALGEPGVRRVPSRGRWGYCYEVDASFVDRWHAGAVATPHPSQYACTKVA